MFLLVLLMAGTFHAQTGIETTIGYDMTVLRNGPGHTYEQVGLLRPGAPIEIMERSFTGTWLHVRAPGLGEDGGDLEGWIMTGYALLDDLDFSGLPVETTLPDADLDNIQDETLRRLYSVPVVPRELSTTMRRVYANGQAGQIHADVITKMGDSNSANRRYLTPLAESQVDLGPYSYLAETAQYYGESLEERSIAAQIGLNAFSIFDPIWSNDDDCEPEEPPIDCELRRKRPAIAMIMFGPNDLRTLHSDDFNVQMRQIVETVLDHNTIPVLSTFSADPADEDLWWQVLRFNGILLDIAAEYDIPVMNLWAAARDLSNYGIGEDKVHLTTSGDRIDFDDGEPTYYGVSLQNLIALHTLDVIRHAVVANDDDSGLRVS
jgi:hypothetical protein